jgi:hypothetical protein
VEGSQAHRQHDNLLRLRFFFQNKECRLISLDKMGRACSTVGGEEECI